MLGLGEKMISSQVLNGDCDWIETDQQLLCIICQRHFGRVLWFSEDNSPMFRGYTPLLQVNDLAPGSEHANLWRYLR